MHHTMRLSASTNVVGLFEKVTAVRAVTLRAAGYRYQTSSAKCEICSGGTVLQSSRSWMTSMSGPEHNAGAIEAWKLVIEWIHTSRSLRRSLSTTRRSSGVVASRTRFSSAFGTCPSR